jgi:hypothetical protein
VKSRTARERRFWSRRRRVGMCGLDWGVWWRETVSDD